MDQKNEKLVAPFIKGTLLSCGLAGIGACTFIGNPIVASAAGIAFLSGFTGILKDSAAQSKSRLMGALTGGVASSIIAVSVINPAAGKYLVCGAGAAIVVPKAIDLIKEKVLSKQNTR